MCAVTNRFTLVHLIVSLIRKTHQRQSLTGGVSCPTKEKLGVMDIASIRLPSQCSNEETDDGNWMQVQLIQASRKGIGECALHFPSLVIDINYQLAMCEGGVPVGRDPIRFIKPRCLTLMRCIVNPVINIQFGSGPDVPPLLS